MPILVISERESVGTVWQQILAQLEIAADLYLLETATLEIIATEAYPLVIIDMDSCIDTAKTLCMAITGAANAPVLVFTPCSEEPHQLDMYDAGAAEVLVKPISPMLFLAKVSAWLRHTQDEAAAEACVRAGVLHLDPAQCILTHEGQNVSLVKLTATECRLLSLLMRNADQLLPTELLLTRVWGFADENTSALRSTLHRLRGKLSQRLGMTDCIEYIQGEGYRFIPLLQSPDELPQQDG